MKQNHKETIMRAFVWSLYSNGETKEEAERLAAKNINLFEKAEGDEIRQAEGHNKPIGTYLLAKHVAEKYLTSLDGFIKEAESKETMLELEDWWQKHQFRASMNLSVADFNEFAMNIMFSLRSKFERENEDDPITVAEILDEQHGQPETCTDLVVRIDQKQLIISDNFAQYAEAWRAEMRDADFIPTAEVDLKDIRDNEKKCKEVEEAIDAVIDEISFHLEEVGKTDPKIKEYTDRLIDSRKKLRVLKEETIAHRKKISHAPKRYMDDQKKKVVDEQLSRIKDAADQLFVGEIAKVRNDADAKYRLVAAYKSKRTVETIKNAVEEEAGRIIEEMNERAARCRSNLKLIEASGHPALFQDKGSLMTLEPESLEKEIKLRVQQDELLKSKVKRNPEKLAELEATVSEIDNVPHLENWYNAHWGEVKESLPHEEDREELLKFCGEHKQKLKSEYAKSVNSPPPPEEPPQGHGNVHLQPDDKPRKYRQKESAPSETEHHEAQVGAEQEEPELISLEMSFSIFGTKKDAKKIANDVYNLIGKNPMLQEDENGNKITLRII